MPHVEDANRTMIDSDHLEAMCFVVETYAQLSTASFLLVEETHDFVDLRQLLLYPYYQ